jgi:hypothetical protein
MRQEGRSSRVGVNAARQQNTEESRKAMEIKVIHTHDTIPTGIPEPGRDRYQRKSKRGLSDDPKCNNKCGIILTTTSCASESQT